jgi:hypothetical protein
MNNSSLSHRSGLLLHVLVETPAMIGFLLFPSSTLTQPQPHAHAVVRQYGLLLGTTNLIIILILFLNLPEWETDTLDELQRRVAGALALYHVGPLLRALTRIVNGRKGHQIAANPWLHGSLHVLCLVLLLAAFAEIV